jgi:hypothetical protein
MAAATTTRTRKRINHKQVHIFTIDGRITHNRAVRDGPVSTKRGQAHPHGGQPRTNTYWHPEKLLRPDKDDDDEDDDED